MKILLWSIVFAVVIVSAVFYGWNKQWENDCNYYKSLPNYNSDKELQHLCEK